MLELEQINKRLGEIPTQIEQIMAERNQLLGYKKALEDVKESEKKPNEKVKKLEKNEG